MTLRYTQERKSKQQLREEIAAKLDKIEKIEQTRAEMVDVMEKAFRMIGPDNKSPSVKQAIQQMIESTERVSKEGERLLTTIRGKPELDDIEKRFVDLFTFRQETIQRLRRLGE